MEQCTFPKLVEHYNLTEGDCNKPVSDVHLECISRSHCEHWKRLPAHLGMDPIVAKDIESGYGDEGTKRHNFFCTWKKTKGFNATYKQLISALLKINCRQDAECVCEMLRDSISGPKATPSPPAQCVSGKTVSNIV